MGTWWRGLAAAVALTAASLAGAQSIESVLAPGPVIEGHKKTENECKACHVPFERTAQDRLCIECHKEQGQDVRQHTGFHGRREPQTCRSCHTEHKGRGAKIAAFDEKAFDHKVTDFALKDKHTEVDCAKCHVAGKKWREASDTCVGCHQKDDTHKGGLGRKCEDCHNAKSWKDVGTFDHDKTKFPLTGKHVDTKCEDCHIKGKYKDTPATCIGCHRKDDEHKGQYGDKCDTCHNAKLWKTLTFNHDTDTKYQLKDKHRAVKCNSCHTGPLYRTKTSNVCVDCHNKDDKHEGTLGRKCETCHNERGWKEPAGFDHNKTRFPLLGKHDKTPCKDCHKDAKYREAPSTCIACHKKDDKHDGTLGEKCADCHGEKDWKPVNGKFDHQKTKFPLRNAHASPKVKCQDCHESLRTMRKTPLDCLSCHKRDDRHEGTMSAKCETCHSDVSWRIDKFDHSRTRYPLTGRHVVTTCRACHVTLRFRDVGSDCVSCHRKDDKHKATLGARCETCHNVRGWTLWDFDHDRGTKYRLEAAHKKVRCQDCHSQPAPKGKAIAAIATDCGGCHRKDDVHEGRFGRRCDLCHSPERWNQIRRR